MSTLNSIDMFRMVFSQIIMAICLLMMTALSEAGGWLRSEGEHRYSAHLESSSADRSWDKDGNDEISSCTSKGQSLTHGYEYGYSYYRTFFGKVSMASSDCGGDKVSGFSDLYLGVRGRLNLYKNGQAWEAIIIIPTGYDSNRSNRLGYGEAGLDLGVYGTTKLSEKYSLNYGGSLRFWAGSPADQFRAKISGSYMQNQNWSYNASLSGNFSFKNGNPTAIQSINGDFESEFDVIRGEIGVRHKLSRRLGMSAGLFKNLWGRDTSQRQGVFINIGYVWGRR